MGRAALKKEERHAFLMEKLRENPFLKDNELADVCHVSVSTIRIDRAQLGIAEYRERVKSVAEGISEISRAELLDLDLYHNGLAVLKTDDNMTFEGTDIIRPEFIRVCGKPCAECNKRKSCACEGGECQIHKRGP